MFLCVKYVFCIGKNQRRHKHGQTTLTAFRTKNTRVWVTFYWGEGEAERKGLFYGNYLSSNDDICGPGERLLGQDANSRYFPEPPRETEQ